MGLVSETAARRCKLPVYSLAQSLLLLFADEKQNPRIGNSMSVKCALVPTTGPLIMVLDSYVLPPHHDMILDMPPVNQ